MDLEKVVASWPILRRVWRWMPKPLRWIVLAVAAVVMWRRWRHRDELEPVEEAGDGDRSRTAGSDGARTDGG